MLNLPETHPEIHAYLLSGGFSTQIGCSNPFGCIPMDQAIEETINKDTQTSGGTRGFSTTKAAVQKFYVTADYRASCVRYLRQMTQSLGSKFNHPDLSISRIKREEEDIKSIQEMFISVCTNPFVLDGLELCNLSTGGIPPADVMSSLLMQRRLEGKHGSHFDKRDLVRIVKQIFMTLFIV